MAPRKTNKQGEEDRSAALDHRAGAVEAPHVAQRVDTDQGADDADDQHHDHRQAVEPEQPPRLELRHLAGEFEVEGDGQLAQDEDWGQDAAVLDADRHHEGGDRDFHDQQRSAQGQAVREVEEDGVAVAEGDGGGDRGTGDHQAGQYDDHVPQVAVADAEEQAACQKWEGDEEDDERTHRLVDHLHEVVYLVGQHLGRNGLVHEPLHGHPVVVVLAVAFSGGEMLVDATEHDQG